MLPSGSLRVGWRIEPCIYIPGGLSGTGSIAVQLAKPVFGVGKVITTLSTEKLAKFDELSAEGTAEQIIDHTKQDPATAIERNSVDFLLDTMIMAMASLNLMKKDSVIVTITGLPFGDSLAKVPLPALARGALGCMDAIKEWRASRPGVNIKFLFVEPSAEHLDRLRQWVNEGKLRPAVGRIVEFRRLEDVRGGCTDVFNGKGNVGKFVVEVIRDPTKLE
ncbi:hypothetical protein S40285_09033 [Stachybotrys chlorohalonatus IBT 40285]|uniref:Alcohol dehydrogenase-like C-terminal domain-containing protein n=1 Tax=Stachybotrys chlorohalonatus (strain IBT 40285) TaxID=1283841 RepID=A0A084QV60_STAC4|nr:hypothetical protein S40285_09033 [Stachybotrys chlorohalonata IBT 40285]